MTGAGGGDAAAKRRGQLGFWMCTALVVGNTIGIGIFMQPASLAPYGANAFLAWAITIVGCAVLAVVFATLARRLPDADCCTRYRDGEHSLMRMPRASSRYCLSWPTS